MPGVARDVASRLTIDVSSPDGGRPTSDEGAAVSERIDLVVGAVQFLEDVLVVLPLMCR